MNNQVSRAMTFTRSGTTFTGAVSGAPVIGPVLTRWSGATTAIGGNGSDDGRFMVGCKVTGPVDGFWHYEFAVHNLDNHSGGAAFRVPVCASARVANAGFRDIDRDTTNEWAVNRTSTEVAFLMTTPNNSINWNTLYNFWFDCDAAPSPGTVEIDRARAGAGRPSVAVAAQVPQLLGQELLGSGCGSPAPVLVANGVPASPNPAYALRTAGASSAPTALVLSLAGDNANLGNGCTRHVGLSAQVASLVGVTDAAGALAWNLPVPPGLAAFDLFGQVVQVVPGGPWLGTLALSNGLRVRVAGSGCQ
jgi:hypothetical protein